MFKVGDKVTFRSLEEFDSEAEEYSLLQCDLDKMTPEVASRVYTVTHISDSPYAICHLKEMTSKDLKPGSFDVFFTASLRKILEIKIPEADADSVWEKVKEILASPPKIAIEQKKEIDYLGIAKSLSGS